MLNEIKLKEVNFEWENGNTFGNLKNRKSQDELDEIEEVCFLHVNGLKIHAYVSVEEFKSDRLRYGMTFNLVNFEDDDEWDNLCFIGILPPSNIRFKMKEDYIKYLKEFFIKVVNHKKWAKNHRIGYENFVKED